MSKLWKKILGIGCAAVIGCSALVGCGGGGGGGGGSNAGNAGSIQEYQWVNDPDFEPIDLSERNVYPEGKGMDDGKLTLFHWMINGGNAMQGTPIYNVLTNKVGMPITAEAATDWKTQVSTLYQTGKLPDIFVHMGPEEPEDYSQMIEEEVLLPISDFVGPEEDQWPNIYNHLKKFDYLRGNLPYSDGRHWSIPVDWNMEHTMYVRKDWIANLNAKIDVVLTEELGRAPTPQERTQGMFNENGPQTLLEFYRLCRAFTVHDPDGDGNNNTYGYTDARYTDFFADCWIFEAFGAGYDRMVNFGTKDEPNFKSSWANDNTKKAVAFMNNLYKSGYMDPDFASKNDGEKEDAFTNGEVGMIEGHARYNKIVENFMATNKSEGWSIAQATEKIGVFAPPKGENGDYGIKGNPNFWTVMCINAGLCDDEVKAALDLFDYLLSEEGYNLMCYGIEGTHYTLDNSKSDYTKYKAKGDLATNKTSQGFNFTLSNLDAAAAVSAISNVTISYFSPYATNADIIIGIMNAAEEYHTYEEFPFLSPDLYVEHWQDLKQMANQDFLPMIKSKDGTGELKGPSLTWANLNNMASSAFNSAWSTYMGKFSSQGGDDMVAEYNETITPETAVRFVKA